MGGGQRKKRKGSRGSSLMWMFYLIFACVSVCVHVNSKYVLYVMVNTSTAISPVGRWIRDCEDKDRQS